MSDVGSVLTAVFLPVVCLWAVVTALVTLGMLRVSEAARRAGAVGAPLPAELWGAVAASGAAGGGVLGFSAVAPALPLGASSEALAAVVAITAAGMLLGAVATSGLVFLATWLWTGDV